PWHRDQPVDQRPREERRRERVHRKPEHRHDVGEDARVVGLLELHVQRDRIARGRDASVELGEADAEPLALVRLRGGGEPGRALVEPARRPVTGEVPEIGVPVDRDARPDRHARERLEERFAPRQHVPREIRLAVARGEELEIAAGAVAAPHRAHRITVRRRGARPRRAEPRKSAAAVTVSRPPVMIPSAIPAAPAAAENVGMPVPKTTPIVMAISFRVDPSDGGGPATIDRTLHFFPSGPAGTALYPVWY